MMPSGNAYQCAACSVVMTAHDVEIMSRGRWIEVSAVNHAYLGPDAKESALYCGPDCVTTGMASAYRNDSQEAPSDD